MGDEPRERLREYRSKRRFEHTPEPSGDEPVAGGGGFSYLIQKHDASRVHFDLRLELDGTLLSWAVPKGPSLDPSAKRLAVHVEDHPLAYGDFEGVIPPGEYGGGTVMLWDRGTWEPVGDPRKGMAKGHLRFTLHGERLGGQWSLVRMGKNDKNWLLTKHKDQWADPSRDLEATYHTSVATGRDFAAIAASADRVWTAEGEQSAGRTQPVVSSAPPAPEAWMEAAAAPKITSPIDPAALPGARPGPLPDPFSLEPQKAMLAADAPEGEDWLHELKYDGYRILALKDGKQVRLVTRGNQDWTAHFLEAAMAVAALPAGKALLDGEVVVVLPDGRTSFEALVEAKNGRVHPGEVALMVFDLLHLDGTDLTDCSLRDRKSVLAGLIPEEAAGPLRRAGYISNDGPLVFANACRLSLEGVVSKRADAVYEAGRRTRTWLKMKCLSRQEFVVGGYTDPSGGRRGFGALLLGVYAGERLVYTGKVGTGFSDATLRELAARLEKLGTGDCPFADCRQPDVPRHAHWVRPELVAEVEFTQWTNGGRLRHPSFIGLREDKPAAQVVREEPSSANPPPPESPHRTEAPEGIKTAPPKGLTHPDRIMYPVAQLTKADLAVYWEHVSSTALPFLHGRPLMLLRCPQGHEKFCFYQKHFGERIGPGLKRVRIPEKEEVDEYAYLTNAAGLLSLVQMGALELHLWGSRADNVERPDTLVFDLDPGEGVKLAALSEAALELRERLSLFGLTSFAKSTGGKGYHVVVPTASWPDWPSFRGFAKALTESMAADSSKRYLTKASKAERQGRIFLDWMRNNRGSTAIAPYSPRAREGAPVAAPISWKEVADNVAPGAFTLRNLPVRLSEPDPWEDYTAASAQPPPKSPDPR